MMTKTHAAVDMTCSFRPDTEQGTCLPDHSQIVGQPAVRNGRYRMANDAGKRAVPLALATSR